MKLKDIFLSEVKMNMAVELQDDIARAILEVLQEYGVIEMGHGRQGEITSAVSSATQNVMDAVMKATHGLKKEKRAWMK